MELRCHYGCCLLGLALASGCATAPVPSFDTVAAPPLADLSAARTSDETDGLSSPPAKEGGSFRLAPTGGRFSVAMPGRPLTRSERFAPVRSVSWCYGDSVGAGGAPRYYAGYIELARPGDLTLLVKRTAGHIAERMSAASSEPRDVVQGGLAGKELRLTASDWEAQARYFFANARLYQVLVLYPVGQAPADAGAFLDSFQAVLE